MRMIQLRQIPSPQVRGPETNLKWEKTTLQIPIRLLIKISKSGKSQLTCPLLWQIAKTMGLVQIQKFSMGSSNHRSLNPSKSAVLKWSDRKILVAKVGYLVPSIGRFKITFPLSPSALSCCLFLTQPCLWH